MVLQFLAPLFMSQPRLPTFDELPPFHDMPGCGWIWGEDDQLGTVNLLSDEVVQRACREQVRIGKSISLNWPINFPEKPLFHRHALQHESHIIHEYDNPAIRDDTLFLSGSQWDGLKHFGVLEHGVYYNNVRASSIPLGSVDCTDPKAVDPLALKLGIQNWANHGICGRGVLLDMVRYWEAKGTPVDPWTSYAIAPKELEECAKAQGITFRRGDILLLRVGFIRKYYESTREERDRLAGVKTYVNELAGIEPTDDMKRFLWNNHFSAIASDQPALEVWPVPEGYVHLHQTLLGLWGMPIGEFFDLEALSQLCADSGRYSFFFSSWPLNILGGVASPPNASAMF
ncbi:hypothetical protein BDM02DRAFT_2999451 [Thelephora ganbajun]|uniref:Uncharacterized protein n=1 Tax=Thelephora ganbajun TaxID=370292 RepID=A0ACB6ZAM5_THEGA|nr:hypothetical protein BDM02DRAFT_2999451 [Thelephora ganbajun]